MHIDVLKIVENDDGSCNIVFEMDRKSLESFAKAGLLSVLKEAAKEIVKDDQSGNDISGADISNNFGDDNDIDVCDDIIWNLLGALEDLKNQKADPVCIRTIDRVLSQIVGMQDRIDQLQNRTEMCEQFELQHRKQIDVLLGELKNWQELGRYHYSRSKADLAMVDDPNPKAYAAYWMEQWNSRNNDIDIKGNPVDDPNPKAYEELMDRLESCNNDMDNDFDFGGRACPRCFRPQFEPKGDDFDFGRSKFP